MQEGEYEVTGHSLSLAPSKTGKAQVSITVKDDDGSLSTGYFSLEGGAKQYTVEMLRGLGLKGKPDTWSQQVTWLRMVGWYKEDTWNGKAHIKLKSLRLPSAKADPKVIEALNADASLDLGGTAETKRNDDDEIPF